MSDIERSILECLSRPGYAPLRPRALKDALGVSEEDYRRLTRELHQLKEEGLVVSRGGRFSMPARTHFLIGRVEVKRAGFGFLKPEGRKDDLFVPPPFLGGAMDGDLVLARKRRSRGRPVASVVKVLERARSSVSGVFVSTGKGGIVLPDARGLSEVEIPSAETGGAEDGQKVLVEFIRFGGEGRPAAGRVARVLGSAGAWEAERASCIAEFGLREEFPPDVLGEAESLPDEVGGGEVEGGAKREAQVTGARAARDRADYSGELCVTIDPQDARDFDDAICVLRSAGGYTLRVHIADVAWYVQNGTALDREARLRGTSVYLPGEVLPMLPERLSTDLCSLKEGKKRLARTATLLYDRRGARRSYKMERSVVASRQRLTYGQVRAALEGEKGTDVRPEVLEMLSGARELHRLIRERRKREGSLDFSFPEVKLVMDAPGEVKAVIRRAEDFSHQMIEDFMLEANRAVAEFLVEKALPGIFRIHEEPDDGALDKFAEAASSFGITLGAPYTKQGLQAAIDKAYAGEFGEDLALVLLRSMKLARYSHVPLPHWALGFRKYCHFTSPIRRYPDLWVHRVLDGASTEAKENLAHLAEHCSLRERAADGAERFLTEFGQLEFLSRHAGGVLEGKVVGTDRAGVDVEVEGFRITGRIPTQALPPDRYRLKRDGSLVGRRGLGLAPGQRVEVRVEDVDLAMRQVRLSLVVKESRQKK